MTLKIILTIYDKFKHLFPVKLNTHRLGNVYLFLTWTVKCLYLIWDSFRLIYLFYWIKHVKYIKLFKIQGTRYYDINVIFILSPKDGLLEFFKFEFRYVTSFSCIWKRGGEVFGTNAMAFWRKLAYMVNSFVFHYIWQLWLIT